jgi:thioredoxin reductase (NADPH)
MEKYDFVIIGAGPAGLSAAIYAARYMMKTIVIGQLPGGTAGYIHKICNYPGFKSTSGNELMTKIIEQVKELNVPIMQDDVLSISKKENEFEIKTRKKNYIGKKYYLQLELKEKN